MLKKCLASSFIENVNELHSYYQVKKSGQIVRNAERLLLLITKYFRTVLYYNDHKVGRNEVEILGRRYLLGFEGVNSDGGAIDLELVDICGSFLNDALSDLERCINEHGFERLVLILGEVLDCKDIRIENKVDILNSEHAVFGERWQYLVHSLSEDNLINAIDSRKSLILRILSARVERLFNNNELEQGVDDLNRSYIGWIKIKVRALVSKNCFVDAYNLLFDEAFLLSKSRSEYIDKPKLISEIVYRAIGINNLFHLDSRENLEEKALEYSRFFEGERLDILRDEIYFNPQNFELGDLSVGMAEPEFSGVAEDDIVTIISFVIPNACRTAVNVKLSGNCELEFSPIDNLFGDPVFRFLDALDLNVSGLPVSFFSDAIGRVSDCTRITVVLKEFYHPDFEVSSGQILEVDLKKERARRGGKYFPHKDLIIDKLLEACEGGLVPDELDLENVDSRMVSNYIVSYVVEEKLLHHKVYLITNFDSYYEVRERYLKLMSDKYLSDDGGDLYDLIHKVDITSKTSFLEYCVRLIKLTLVKSIELGGLDKAFWKEGVPVLEREAQPIIYNQLRYICEIKGINLTRECVAANGGLDFAFMYSKNGKMMTVCVELKLAHHDSLEHGIATQLPLYIKDIGSKEGIFLVLWCKGEGFDRPKSFETPLEVREHLNSLRPEHTDIRVLVANCAKKLPPSSPKRALDC